MATAPVKTADHPRIRGEHDVGGADDDGAQGSSPHTRGAPVGVEVVGERAGIIPAYAGSTRLCGAGRRRFADHPRIRGEHRSWTTRSGPGIRIIPAYAGSTRRIRSPPTRCENHPRIRGEHQLTEMSSPYFLGSSPHTRGALLVHLSYGRARRIIPAYAGSTHQPIPRVSRMKDHPRIRGEHLRRRPFGAVEAGSSPHTRGAQPLFLAEGGDRRIIPAYAGSTTSVVPSVYAATDHPRIRGEHTQHACVEFPGHGSSPHTRGALGPGVSLCLLSRIIPAYAGSTLGGAE